MALFGKKKKDDVSTEVAVVAPAVKPSDLIVLPRNLTSVILRPRITEKAAMLSGQNVYVFEVAPGAKKGDVRAAIEAQYKVKPIAVHIVNRRTRHAMSRMRGRLVTTHGQKKAYVYLKKDDRIELV